MSSFQGEIISQLELKIPVMAPGFKKSPYVYGYDKNNTKTNVKNFRVFPGNGNSIPGTMKTLTKAQQFSIALTTSYVEVGDTDKDLQEKIEVLAGLMESLQDEGMKRHFTINRIMSVSEFSFSEPDIDPDNKTVSLITTFTINYRMG